MDRFRYDQVLLVLIKVARVGMIGTYVEYLSTWCVEYLHSYRATLRE